MAENKYRTLHTPAAAEDLADEQARLADRVAALEQKNQALEEQLRQKQDKAGGKKSKGALILGLAAAAALVVVGAFALSGGDRQAPAGDTAAETPDIISDTEGDPEGNLVEAQEEPSVPAQPAEETVSPEPEKTEQFPPETTQNDVDYAEGIAYVDGTFQVSNGSGLAAFRDIVNGENAQLVEGYSETEVPNHLPDSNALLTADIDLADDSRPEDGSWMPIGARGIGYYGTFDGGGHTIYDLYGQY